VIVTALVLAAAVAARPATPRVSGRPPPARAAAPDAAPARPPDLRAAPTGHLPLSGDTRCGACHTEVGWKEVRFAHERTGFPLEGRHVDVGCRSCHPAGFAAPVKGACASCHRDPHAGELGTRCAGCHDAQSWEGRFSAEAHRRTKFPLSGRHAFIPCEECHGNRRDRSFARRTVDCVACHAADRARAAVVSVDHDAAGLVGRCQGCHSPWRFRDAVFPRHDSCFELSRGPHKRVRCMECHNRPLNPTNGTCSTGSAGCTRCHACATVNPQHAGVPGFACTDGKCYGCHRFSGGG
jgi:hypothetical protein